MMQDVYESLDASLGPAGAVVASEDPYGLIRVVGVDAADFLHRLCSQDVTGLAVGEVRPAAFLTPKGKLVATASVARAGDVDYLVETRIATLATVFELLDRYHFTEKLELARDVAPAQAELRGPGALALAGLEAGRLVDLGDGLVAVATSRRGCGSVRWHGSEERVARALPAAPRADAALTECLRIAACDPRVGVDTEDATLALEADLDDHVSTTKGCYTGQEIVARIHTYGHVNRKLTRLTIDAAAPVEVGTPLFDPDEGERIGRVMSSAPLPAGDRCLALGFLPDGFADDPEPLALGAADGPRVQVIGLGPA